MLHNVTMRFLFLASIVVMNYIYFSKEIVSLNEDCCRYFYLDFTDRLRHNGILKEIYIQFLEPTPKINKNAASEDDWMWCLREAAMGAMGASAVAACKNHHLHPAVQLN